VGPTYQRGRKRKRNGKEGRGCAGGLDWLGRLVVRGGPVACLLFFFVLNLFFFCFLICFITFSFGNQMSSNKFLISGNIQHYNMKQQETSFNDKTNFQQNFTNLTKMVLFA
jgi:hypothetical protein